MKAIKQSLKRYAFKAMGCGCEIQLVNDSRIEAKRIARQLITEAERLEKKYSRYREDSLVSKINGRAGASSGIEIDPETRSLFDHALSCYEQSEGLFDITSGKLSRIWDFKKATLPSQSTITAALNWVGYEKLTWDESTLFLPKGMEVDFGGIVKEYAADSLCALAKKLGCKSGLVNLGGDYSVIGPDAHGDGWRIGISNPESPQLAIATWNLKQGGLASSGDYERFFLHQGVRYSHLLNPKTGWPSQGLRAVSVASKLCTIAGSISTIAMLKNESDGIAWLNEISVPHIFMKQDGSIGGSAVEA